MVLTNRNHSQPSGSLTEVSAEKLTLHQVLKDSSLLEEFRGFLKLEFCVENLMVSCGLSLTHL